ncbi:cyclic nucleotide-binding domain-containing protein [Anaerolineales bacterium HSG25]|nr:cyclic nucleotide-binding domain-containing protein [Anaerolineales bacterium HSG25]
MLSTTERANHLKKIVFFAGIPDKSLYQLAKSGHEKRYQADEIIITEGSEGHNLYIVLQGELDIIKGHQTEFSQIIAHVEAGDLIGEMALLEKKPRFATVVACRDSVIMTIIPFGAFTQVVAQNPSILARMVVSISQRLRQAQYERSKDYKAWIKQLRKKEAETLAVAESTLLGVVRHELRTPISNIRLTTEILERSGELSKLSPLMQDQITRIKTQAKQADKHVSRLVEYAQALSEASSMVMHPFDTVALLEEVIDSYDQQITQAGVEITVELPDEPVWTIGDKTKLFKAMVNLLENGLKFGGDCMIVQLQYHDTSISYEIVDVGIGLPKDKTIDIWQPFVQGVDTVRRGTEGLGLGLPITKFIVESHGGKVWSRGVLGGGSHFGFSIPIIEVSGGLGDDALARPRKD